MASKRRPRARRARRTGANQTKSKLTKLRISHPRRTDNRQAAATRHQLERQRALAVLARMRRGESFSQAARLEHTRPRTVLKFIGKQLTRGPTRRYVATSGDTIRRDLNVLGFSALWMARATSIACARSNGPDSTIAEWSSFTSTRTPIFTA
jgi:hypothetical protein